VRFLEELGGRREARIAVIALVTLAMVGSWGTLAVAGPVSPAQAAIPTAAAFPSITTSASATASVSPSTGSLAALENPLPANYIPHIAYHGPAFPHTPLAWDPEGAPPGAPLTVSSALSSGSPPGVHGVCVGKWPSGGQSYYSAGCIGHDEPAINPFSNLPGSGGNVSWDVALPVSAGPHHLQADVYIAVWFGMDLYDPYGYNTQCFLELQMYPDTNAQGNIQENAWSAFAVAWQIQLSTGFEDPCFAAPLLEQNGSPIQMNGGDHLYVNMTGWMGSPYGENISISDATTGARASLTLYNTTGNYPLDPAYLANNVQDSLPWSPGGDLPVAFAFESGHTVNDPENDTFGGCNAGAPPPTPLNPSTPCGSYNPRSWAQDTRVPWRFYSVTFFNSHESQVASQFGFEQDFGAMAWINGLSEGTCTGKDGSAYCSYPWYSYSASERAFNFGATDYANTTQDFGQYNEYDTSLVTDSSGLNFYPVKNFTYRDPFGGRLRVEVDGPGSVHFLSTSIREDQTFVDLPPGAYSLNAVPEAGSYFEGYTGMGGIQLDAAATPFSSFTLSGNAVLVAHFGPTPETPVAVRFSDTGQDGTVTVVPGFSFPLSALDPPGDGFALLPIFSSSPTTVAPGGTLQLGPGIYSLQANPKPGYNFTGWSTHSRGLYIFTPESNYTWVNVTGPGGTIVAHYSPTTEMSTVYLFADPAGGGLIEFDHHLYPNGAVLTVPVGAYPVRAVPAYGYAFTTWGAGFMATMTDYRQSSIVLAQPSAIYLTAAFSSAPLVTNAATHGFFVLNGVRVTSSASFPQVGDSSYVLEAVADPGYVFSHWTVGNPHDAWIASFRSPITSIQLNSSVHLGPVFVPEALTATMSFTAFGGSIQFNVVDTFRGHTTLGDVGAGTYEIAAQPRPGYQFEGWTTEGAISVRPFYWFNVSTMADVENLAGTWSFYYMVDVQGPGGLIAHFAPTTVPVTYINFPFDTDDLITIQGNMMSEPLGAGATTNLAPSLYLITYHGELSSFRWFGTNNLTVLSPTHRSTWVRVMGSGTLYLVAEPLSSAAGAAGPAAGSPHFAQIDRGVGGGATFQSGTLGLAADWKVRHRPPGGPA
jgi:hypothetical protein